MFFRKKKKLTYSLIMAMGCIFLGTNAVVTQGGIEATQPLLYSGIRYIIIGLLLIPFFFRSRKHLSGEITSILIVNTLLLLFVLVTLSYALDNTTALTLTLTTLLTPLVLYIGSILYLREKFSAIALIGAMLGLMGGAIVVISPLIVKTPAAADDAKIIGNILAIASSIGMAALALHTKKTFKHLSIFETISYRSIFAGILMSIAGIATSQQTDFSGFATLSVWSSLLTASTVGGAIGLWLFYLGLKNIRAEDSAPLFYLDPLTSFILAVVLLGDTFTTLSAIGSVVIITGVIIGHPIHTQRLHFYLTPHHSSWAHFKLWVSQKIEDIEHKAKVIIN